MNRDGYLLCLACLSFVVGCSSGTGEGDSMAGADSATTVADDTASPERPANCDRWNTAFGNVSQQTLLAMQVLTTDAGFAQQRDPNLFAALKIDLAALKSGVEALAEVPNPSDPGPFRQPGEAVAQLREIVALLKSHLPAGAPFSDGTGDGEKLIRLLDDFNIGGRAAIHSAMEKAGCR